MIDGFGGTRDKKKAALTGTQLQLNVTIVLLEFRSFVDGGRERGRPRKVGQTVAERVELVSGKRTSSIFLERRRTMYRGSKIPATRVSIKIVAAVHRGSAHAVRFVEGADGTLREIKKQKVLTFHPNFPGSSVNFC